MKCKRCGYEENYDFIFCPGCGFETPVAPVYENVDPRVSKNPAYTHLAKVLGNNLFLAFCILMTAHCGITMIGGSGFNIISILLTVFSWLVYSSAKGGTVDSSKLRFISGTVYANYIVSLVASIILIVCSFILFICGGMISSLGLPAEEMQEVLNEIESELPFVADSFSFSSLVDYFRILAVFMAGLSAVTLIGTLLGTRIIHRFVKSVYESVDAGCISYRSASLAANWLFVFGGFEAVSTVGSLFFVSSLSDMSEIILPLIGSLAYSAALIVAGIFIKKHFAETSES